MCLTDIQICFLGEQFITFICDSKNPKPLPASTSIYWAFQISYWDRTWFVVPKDKEGHYPNFKSVLSKSRSPIKKSFQCYLPGLTKIETDKYKINKEATWQQPRLRIICHCWWGCVLNKHIWLLTSLTPTQLARGLQTSWSISKTSLFSVIRFHPETFQKLPTAAATPAKCSFLFFWKPTRSFSCRGSETGGLEFPGPGQQGLSVGLVPFHRGPGRPGPAH